MATDRTERLLNLVLCLLGTRRPVPRATLQHAIPGYADVPSEDAFERMFERDKDELRGMGIPVETVLNSAGEVEGYLIYEGAYGMPDIRLDAAELGVLGLAARMWSDAVVGSHAAMALRKLEATSDHVLDVDPLFVGQSAPGEGHLPPLWEAIRSRRVVRFDYLGRGRDVTETRLVEPWATVRWQGAWYLGGFSRERSEPRAFRLSRIQGAVAIQREVFASVEHDDIEALVAQLSDPPRSGTALVVPPTSGGAHLRARATFVDDTTWAIDFADDETLMSHVLEAGGTIVDPPDLTARMREAIVRVSTAHGETHA